MTKHVRSHGHKEAVGTKRLTVSEKHDPDGVRRMPGDKEQEEDSAPAKQEKPEPKKWPGPRKIWDVVGK